VQTLKEFEELVSEIIKADANYGGQTFRSGLSYGRSGDIVVVEQNPNKKSVYAMLQNAGGDIRQVIDVSKNQYIGVFINKSLLFYDSFLQQFFDLTELKMWVLSQLPEVHVSKMQHYELTIYKKDKVLATIVKNTLTSKQTFLVSAHAIKEYLGGGEHGQGNV
jgi:uncharacterized lipoprotein YehR (DUF1307 family)